MTTDSWQNIECPCITHSCILKLIVSMLYTTHIYKVGVCVSCSYKVGASGNYLIEHHATMKFTKFMCRACTPHVYKVHGCVITAVQSTMLSKFVVCGWINTSSCNYRRQ